MKRYINKGVWDVLYVCVFCLFAFFFFFFFFFFFCCCCFFFLFFFLVFFLFFFMVLDVLTDRSCFTKAPSRSVHQLVLFFFFFFFFFVVVVVVFFRNREGFFDFQNLILAST